MVHKRFWGHNLYSIFFEAMAILTFYFSRYISTMWVLVLVAFFKLLQSTLTLNTRLTFEQVGILADSAYML